MKLDEFVKNTLLDITKGVSEAQDESLLYVAPGFVEGEKQTEGQFVTFEVDVTVTGEGGGGISVLGIGELKGSASREAANRISFQVPVHFNAPTPKNGRHYSNTGPIDYPPSENKK
ncbi:hypothetical protein CLV80_105144 [Yoonia maritima]|uniref:Uncharacterized protein n=1 Tax=Yoonia maritima TaxID=1435347 RepID=A0A2T0VZB8_9RHOB|nr:hypothetical protein [Yoonia maritima]PRY77661.1 hypothetical protein CLV80_105144 [Yoonia maritima]